MAGISEFAFVGHIARITPLDRVSKVRAIANYARKTADGTWEDDPHAVPLTVFGNRRRAYVDEHLNVGDLIMAQGRMKEDRYEKDGQTRYEMSLVVSRIDRLPARARTTASSEPHHPHNRRRRTMTETLTRDDVVRLVESYIETGNEAPLRDATAPLEDRRSDHIRNIMAASCNPTTALSSFLSHAAHRKLIEPEEGAAFIRRAHARRRGGADAIAS